MRVVASADADAGVEVEVRVVASAAAVEVGDELAIYEGLYLLMEAVGDVAAVLGVAVAVSAAAIVLWEACCTTGVELELNVDLLVGFQAMAGKALRE